MKSPRLTVCICTYDRYDVLPKAIESALNQDVDRDLYRVLVVDNSPDHAKAAEYGAQFRDQPLLKYHVEKVPGLSNARNVGAHTCGTEFIAFMDDDAIADSKWVAKIIEAFDAFGPEAAVVGGRVDPIWDAPRPQWLDESLLGYVSVVNWGGNLREPAPNEWFAGTNITFRTDAVIKHGLFDVKLGRIGGGANLLSNEEVELVRRIRDAGGIAVYQPEATVQHLVERRRVTQNWFRKRVAWQAVSDFLLDPKLSGQRSNDGWEWLLEFFFGMPPHLRNIRALYAPCEKAEDFKHQLQSVYTATSAILNGFQGIGDKQVIHRA
jgi:glycosyltransferase involved in cell wall biosynthesis